MSADPRAGVLTIARQIVAGDVDPLEGCRAMVHLGAKLADRDRDDPDFLVLRGIESETDHFPMGLVRKHWDVGALTEQDRKRAEYIERNRAQLIEACWSVIRRLSCPINPGIPRS
jgi:hypothetical protein